jgi:ribulose-phosphate 3-epimerase
MASIMPRRDCLDSLRQERPAIFPSLLNGDFGHLAREIEQLEQAGARAIHLDVMDGHFVPNITIGLPVVEAVRRLTRLPVDVHLMITNPAEYARRFYEAGADMITFHIEAVTEPAPILEEIRSLGAATGLVLNPGTPVDSVLPWLELCDLILVMSVQAGFGGQSFHPVALEKLRRLRVMAGPDFLLEIDGGVNQNTINDCVRAGADLLVIGTAILECPPYRPVMEELMTLAADRKSE